jgi:hypothetical protein
MSDVIALVWDFDKTLVEGYMQDPIFREYNLDPKEFWKENNDEIKRIEKSGLWVNHDTFYLNFFIRKIKDGTMEGLNNEKLKELGLKIQFYKGVESFFPEIQEMVSSNEIYSNYDIKLEHYIISTGFRQMIEGCSIRQYVKKAWGCELLEDEQGVPCEIGYTIDNTSKTRALFEISKGAGIDDRNNIDVNSKIPESERRVHFINMVYIADGPSDIPAFSVINKNGGATFAVYPKGNEKALKQVDKMRAEGRVQMYAEADYSKETTARLWLENTVSNMADKIVKANKDRLNQFTSGTPQHLI